MSVANGTLDPLFCAHVFEILAPQSQWRLVFRVKQRRN